MRVGKSSLLNALVGADLAVTGVNETTATINWFKYAEGERCDRFRVVWKNKPEEEFSRSEIAQWVGNSAQARNTLRLEFFADVPFLKNAYIVDTPGTRAVIDAHEEVVQNFIADKQDVDKTDTESREQGDRADAIIYALMPVTRETDEDLLRSFEQGSRIPNAAPYNSVAVIHKWETINCPDPYQEVLKKTDWIAGRFKEHVAEVLPVSAPMGWACEHFDDGFWQTAFDIGSLKPDILKRLFLTDTRFIAETSGCDISGERRKQFRDDYKLPWPTLKFIINRVALENIASPHELKMRIHEISGIGKLREMLDKRFFSRSKMIRRFGILGKTLPVCDEGSVTLRNHKILYSKLVDDAGRAVKELAGVKVPMVVGEYIEETRDLVQADLKATAETLNMLDELAQPVRDAFEEMNNDTKYLDQLDLLDRYDWAPEWKPKLARLFGQSGPEMENRLSAFVPDQSALATANIVDCLENALGEMIRLQSGITGAAKSLLQHARDRLGQVLDQLESNEIE